MPRVSVCENWEDFDSGRSVDPMNNNLDYCKDCYAYLVLEYIAEKYGVPDEAVEMGCEHPWYEDWYTCESCGCELTAEDE